MKKIINNTEHALNFQQKSSQAVKKSSQIVETFAENNFVADDFEKHINYFNNNMYFFHLKIIISIKV